MAIGDVSIMKLDSQLDVLPVVDLEGGFNRQILEIDGFKYVNTEVKETEP